jgi:uncharacterized protein (DUF779 family)
MTREDAESDPAVTASPEALEMVQRLGAAHGALIFVQSGGCCNGSSPICLQQGELPLGPQDVWLGEIAGAPFYIDSEQYERWGRPHLTIEVSPGEADGFSLEGREGVHFITRTAT